MTDNSEIKEYILGVNSTELRRLEFQHDVWKEVTDSFLNKINIQKGWKCLDVGAGPGFVSMQFLDLTGETGEVTALEPGKIYLDNFREYCRTKKIENAKFINSSLENAELEENHYDLIFLRWVIDFVSDPGNFLLKLLRSLKKGGVIALQDYAYEGIALFPKGGPFDNIADYVRKYWIAGGGDPYFTTNIPAVFRKENIELMEFSPVSLAGDNRSNIFRWAYLFFKGHLHSMTELNIISKELEAALDQDLESHYENPDTVFFSPVIVNIIGKKK
ncbi:MAG: class I SAM-dependent methyltransferase [Bacteroidetes bacterium]|nr:class I SAM-dependent methyltransferase [Bacteroidota bacterium]